MKKQQFVMATRLSIVGRAPSFSRVSSLIKNFSIVTTEKRHHESGPVVVEMTDEKARKAMKSYKEDMIITPLVKYEVALAPNYPPHIRRVRTMLSAAEPARAVKKIKFKVLGPNSKPAGDVTIVAFFNFRLKWGTMGITDKKGVASLDIPSDSSPANFEVVYVYPEHSYWNVRRVGLPVTDLEVQVSTLPQVHGYEWWAEIVNTQQPRNRRTLGKNVKVAVVDTGVGPHSDLKISSGENFTAIGSRTDYKDVQGHGSHVAGTIAASGELIGIAPGAELFAARVFPSKDDDASNSDISEAIRVAVDDWKCDIINLSLGGPYDPLIEDRINYATDRGTLCVVAAGNSRGPVEYPGALRNSYCVAALGQVGRYPDDSIHKETEPESRGLFGRDNLFAADFTCRGPEVDACAPGVAIISTFPTNKYAALDGTSMACPIVAGISAIVMGQDPQIIGSPRLKQRTELLRSKVDSILDDIRLPADVQGKGFVSI